MQYHLQQFDGIISTVKYAHICLILKKQHFMYINKSKVFPVYGLCIWLMLYTVVEIPFEYVENVLRQHFMSTMAQMYAEYIHIKACDIVHKALYINANPIFHFLGIRE